MGLELGLFLTQIVYKSQRFSESLIYLLCYSNLNKLIGTSHSELSLAKCFYTCDQVLTTKCNITK